MSAPNLGILWAEILSAEKPRLSPEYIDAVVEASEVFVTKLGTKTTVIQLVMPNGFAITTHSSCVDPANYDEALGVKYALQRAKDKVWELEGYRLQSVLHTRRCGSVDHG